MSTLRGRNSSGTTFCLSTVNFMVLQEMSLLRSATAMCVHVCGERGMGRSIREQALKKLILVQQK